MIKKWSFIPAIAAAHALIAVTTSASAADRSCRADIEKYCADVSRGGGRVAECLRRHYAGLSPECKARGQELHERAQEAHEACRSDIAKYCREIQPGTGRIVACLGEHGPDLSTDCKAALKPAR